MMLVKTRLQVSPVHGLGLFADEDIEEGTVLWVYHEGFDRMVDLAALDTLPEPAKAQLLHYGYVSMRTGQLVLCMDDGRYFNHADDPNTGDAEHEHPEGATVAKRRILRGEELYCNYLEEDGDGRRKLGLSVS